jgi:polysaccharide export outer membrane protein
MKHKRLLKLCLALIALLGITACNSYKNVPYFQNSKDFDGTQGALLYDLIIKQQDELNIFVYSPYNDELAATFNKRERSGLKAGQKVGDASNQAGFYHYLVDTDGNIDFPQVGKIHVAGLTIEQTNAAVKEALKPYFKDDNSYMINTYMLNYYVSVMGEVKRPGSFSVERNKMTVLEALAKAGDMTDYGRRDNLKVLRELSDGTYEVHELDMRDANILNSPYYYLQQRDIVYVEPNEAMVQNSEIGQTTRLWLRGASITISLGSLLYRVLQ